MCCRRGSDHPLSHTESVPVYPCKLFIPNTSRVRNSTLKTTNGEISVAFSWRRNVSKNEIIRLWKSKRFVELLSLLKKLGHLLIIYTVIVRIPPRTLMRDTEIFADKLKENCERNVNRGLNTAL